jgi:hypothetical protein
MMNEYLPDNDGIDHINVYSKGKTELGQLLSNFAHTPFSFNKTVFSSVEAAWYTYKLVQVYQRGNEEFKTDLLTLYKQHGFQAKQVGRKLLEKWGAIDCSDIPKSVLKEVYLAKLDYNPYIWDMLRKNEKPLAHYYVMDGNKVDAAKYFWTVKLWQEIKNESNT